MKWVPDPAHTLIEFSAKHMMIATVRGRFDKFQGTLDLDEQHPERSVIEGSIDVSSIDTGDQRRDDHLRSPDFFDVQKWPAMTFRSTRIQPLGDNRYKLTGDLRIRDVTRPITFDVEYLGQAKSPWGGVAAGFSAQTRLNRKDYGLNWNVALEAGGWLVSDDIRMSIELEIVPQAEVGAAAKEAEEEADEHSKLS